MRARDVRTMSLSSTMRTLPGVAWYGDIAALASTGRGSVMCGPRCRGADPVGPAPDANEDARHGGRRASGKRTAAGRFLPGLLQSAYLADCRESRTLGEAYTIGDRPMI